MDTPPTMSQFASREACLLARDKWFQEQLEAAKQRELELLAVIRIARSSLLMRGLNEVADMLAIEPSQALREHEAKVLVDYISALRKQPSIGLSERQFGELKRVAEERRKK